MFQIAVEPVNEELDLPSQGERQRTKSGPVGVIWSPGARQGS